MCHNDDEWRSRLIAEHLLYCLTVQAGHFIKSIINTYTQIWSLPLRSKFFCHQPQSATTSCHVFFFMSVCLARFRLSLCGKIRTLHSELSISISDTVDSESPTLHSKQPVDRCKCVRLCWALRAESTRTYRTGIVARSRSESILMPDFRTRNCP